MTVEIRDAATGLPAAYRASLTIQSSTHTETRKDESAPTADSLRVRTLFAGLDEPGTYTVTVSRPGYATWTKTGVVARATDCGVTQGVLLQVALQPLAPTS